LSQKNKNRTVSVDAFIYLYRWYSPGGSTLQWAQSLLSCYITARARLVVVGNLAPLLNRG